MIEIYRVEHRDTGKGPFQTDDPFTQDLVSLLVRNLNIFPRPGDDGLGLADIPHWFVFGCPDIETMKRWVLLGNSVSMNQYIVKKLDELGFVLSYYVVEDYLVRLGRSGIQLAFGKTTYQDECIGEHQSIKSLMKETPMVFCLQ